MLTYPDFLKQMRDTVVIGYELLSSNLFNVFLDHFGAPIWINGTFRRVKPTMGAIPDDQISRGLMESRNRIVTSLQATFLNSGTLSSG